MPRTKPRSPARAIGSMTAAAASAVGAAVVVTTSTAAAGGLGVANGAWNEWGGCEFAPNAAEATREQQIIVAERIRADVGLGAWGCAR